MNKTGIEDYYIIKNNKKLYYGYTTGTCAAAAAKAAALMLVTGRGIAHIDIVTPKGIKLDLKVEEVEIVKYSAKCAIRKYSGDDPDVTNGVLVYAKVSKSDKMTIDIDGGIGVGRVTKPGLEQPVGSAAINKVPRKMIISEVEKICMENDYNLGLNIEISVPYGVEIAKKTFNPRLGILGGISILGTSGIVEPMSEDALIESIKLEINMKSENNEEYLIVTPGNYGSDFIKEISAITDEQIIKCSNYVGETIDIAKELGFKGILFISHIGKFIKVAGGIMNTHSRWADARMEIMAANAILAGASSEKAMQILSCINTDDAIDILNKAGLREATMKRVIDKVQFYLKNRAYNEMEMEVIIFSNIHGVLGKTDRAEKILQLIK